MEIEFDVKIDAGVLYDYMLHHTYSSFSGVLGTAVGALILVGFAATGYVIYLIAGIVILAYLPWSGHDPEQVSDLSQLEFSQGLGPAILFFFDGDTVERIVLTNMFN